MVASQESSAPSDDSVSFEIDALADYLRSYSSAIIKLAHLQTVLGGRFEKLTHDLQSFGFQRRRNFPASGFR